MNNLTIIRGPRASGKTTRLRKIERDAKASGLNVAWIEGSATEAGIEAKLQHGNMDVLLSDETEDGTAPARIALFTRLAARHRDIRFAIVSAS